MKWLSTRGKGGAGSLVVAMFRLGVSEKGSSCCRMGVPLAWAWLEGQVSQRQKTGQDFLLRTLTLRVRGWSGLLGMSA